MMADASRRGSRPPAFAAIQCSARSSTIGKPAMGLVGVDRPGADGKVSPSAAQTSVVVLRLLRLSTVSPQPPSGFAWAANQAWPFWTVAPSRASSDNKAFRSGAASTIRRAQTAVAVDRALVASSPTQWPEGSISASKAAVAWELAAAMESRKSMGNSKRRPIGAARLTPG